MTIYQVYRRIVYDKVYDYKTRMATEDRLRKEGFKYLPNSKVMEKIIYKEDGYEEREIAFPRLALR